MRSVNVVNIVLDRLRKKTDSIKGLAWLLEDKELNAGQKIALKQIVEDLESVVEVLKKKE